MEAPALDIPASKNTVSVAVVDSASDIIVPTGAFMSPLVPGFEKLEARSFFFLIEQAAGQDGKAPRRILFDLGLRQDWATGLSPVSVKGLRAMLDMKTTEGEPAAKIEVTNDAHTILQQGGVDTDSIEAIVWSHSHVDHTGNPSLFGPNTALVIGPGFGTGTCSCIQHQGHSHPATDEALAPHIFPGYPQDPESVLLESDYKGRTLRELTSADFGTTTIAGLRAFDYFGDGSFYLLDTPGHSPGHLCGLARVQAGPAAADNHFVLMLGDGIHHMSEMRPNPYKPLPAEYAQSTTLFSHFPGGSPTKPLFVPAGTKGASVHLDPQQATAIIAQLAALDAHDNVFSVAAHDMHVYKVLVDAAKTGAPALFPDGTVNDFVARGFVQQTQWTFMKDLVHLV
ncbi:hypothetical protein SCUCBS95973_001375 [Sporothrix curviconia]|uniref:Metallo-beta-lactamase domain-containing protein n=1 Tax=Sporothrix curviconia TaxID=1260050 RepID=A0ABP0AYA1_9PEZI